MSGEASTWSQVKDPWPSFQPCFLRLSVSIGLCYFGILLSGIIKLLSPVEDGHHRASHDLVSPPQHVSCLAVVCPRSLPRERGQLGACPRSCSRPTPLGLSSLPSSEHCSVWLVACASLSGASHQDAGTILWASCRGIEPCATGGGPSMSTNAVLQLMCRPPRSVSIGILHRHCPPLWVCARWPVLVYSPFLSSA